MKRLRASDFELVNIRNILDYGIRLKNGEETVTFVSETCPASREYIAAHPSDNYIFYQDEPLIFYYFKVKEVPNIMKITKWQKPQLRKSVDDHLKIG